MVETIPVIEGSLTTPRVRRITLDHPWQWLMAGWKDTLRTPFASLFYGAAFVFMGYFVTFIVTQSFQMALALTTGFMLAGPFLAMGLYDLSRALEKDETPSLFQSLFAWRHNLMAILLFGIAIGLIMIIWARLSALLFAAIFLDTTSSVDSSAANIFFSGDGLVFLLVFAAVGAVLSLLVFSISVVSIPMMLDSDTDVITAVATSVLAVKVNVGPMILWAALIVVFTGVGLATFYLGLAITMPLIGHATWHAYRDIVFLSKHQAV
ncbi:MAG: DUF2189 domain-containing protein [Gammaproteobacteria bacterium]|nr:DUF2189 domain-containing protein [Gammaproteobacteria bacterium]